MENVVQARKHFCGHHTLYKIMEEYEQIIKGFGISSKITNIITDNATNKNYAFLLPGFYDTIQSELSDKTELDDDLNDADDSELLELLPTEHSMLCS